MLFTIVNNVIMLINYTSYSIIHYSYHNLLKRGVRIALRAKVNDSSVSGLRIVDSILPVGRGQRQLICHIIMFFIYILN